MMKKLFLFLCIFYLSFSAQAKTDFSSLFISLSDAMAEVKKDAPDVAHHHLLELETHFTSIPNNQSPAGQAVSNALRFAKNTPNNDTLEMLAKALLTFEKEQNPVDYSAKREQFAKRVMPIYKKLNDAIKLQDIAEIHTAYKRFNNTWTVNEKVVRETSLGHYGQIETSMTLMRVAMLAEPTNFAEIIKQSERLGVALTDFNAGNVLQPQANTNNDAPQTLPEGIKLLSQAYSALENGHNDQARSDITLFIQQWAIFEGDVRTRDSNLYTRIESDLPVIMAKGGDSANLRQFAQLIDDLKSLDLNANYSVIDAMLILLREGLEALLIIMALITTLNVSKQPKAKHYVYLGAGLGLFASILGAIALQQLFPAITAGSHREILEGFVGIIAVIMMLFVGAWLHSKSSIQGWTKFVNKQIGKALATGSLFSMMLLSFLSVFREGAETILFYAGILPYISTFDFLLGIGFAIALLSIIAYLLHRTSTTLPIHHLFKTMTWLIYGLGFKILGVSINALQLTQTIPRSLIEYLPNIPEIGFYASWQGCLAQLGYLLLIPIIAKMMK